MHTSLHMTEPFYLGRGNSVESGIFTLPSYSCDHCHFK